MQKRVFVGVPFDAEAQRGVEGVFKLLARKHWTVAWEGVEKLHVTVAFLGNTETERLDVACQAVALGARGVAPFRVGFKGLGAFPDLFLPNVIWVGLKGDLKSLARLYKQVRRELVVADFSLPERAFVPHVTLGRVKKVAGRKQRLEMGKEIGRLRQMEILQQLTVDRVVVYESILTPSGSTYRILEEISLV